MWWGLNTYHQENSRAEGEVSGMTELDRRDPRTLLEQLVRHREATYEELAEQFNTLAEQLEEKAAISVRHLQRLASGNRPGARGTPGTRRVLRVMFGYPFDELLGPPSVLPCSRTTDTLGLFLAPDPLAMVADSARDSLEFASWADADQVARATLDHLTYELSRIAVDYVYTPLLPLFRDLVNLRDTTKSLLRSGPNPRQARELFFLAGVTCTLLAHASQNLGDSVSARAQARSAWSCAEQADHDGLRAWVLGTQALIAEWSQKPDEAVRLAREGQRYATICASMVRLACIEARAVARAGDARAAGAAVEKARRARDGFAGHCDDLESFGGLLTFPIVKQTYYAGSTLVLMGRHHDAERSALKAIQMYEAGPTDHRSYGDEALARVDVAAARLGLNDLDGAQAALEPVFRLPPERRIKQISAGLARTRALLAVAQYAQARAAVEINAQLDTFGVPRANVLPGR
jgi:tetratricopeptide (TPR) repeat protein